MHDNFISLGADPDLTATSMQPEFTPSDPAALPMLQVYIPMMTASALAAAGRLGLFEALSASPLDGSALAAKLSTDRDGVERLAEFLVATRHLVREGQMFANAPETTRWFTSRGTVDYSPGLAWSADAWAIMDDLAGAVRRGGPELLLWDRLTAAPELARSFSRYMRAFAQHISPDLMGMPGLPADPARLLDLGGSHGIHTMTFCHRFPRLQATIVDLEPALTETMMAIEVAGYGSRVEVRAGDIRTSDWGAEYDIALYLGVAHNMTAADNQAIFHRLAKAIRPGGVLVVHDYPRDMTPSLFDTAFRLTLLTETGTRTFEYSELSKMLTDAGFSKPRAITLSPAEKGTLIVARR